MVIRELPREPEPVRRGLVRLRDRYEAIATDLVEALPLAPDVDRRALRLMLLGALNWSPTWYRPSGEAPGEIAAAFVGLLRRRLEAGEDEE